ncbi:hypothetical protein C4579_04200 [Candidatus Microgenomates bacterium]|nr:MAG: hypothetical protein C4579_04200 [Candidatus Microgenomates bacterium]
MNTRHWFKRLTIVGAFFTFAFFSSQQVSAAQYVFENGQNNSYINAQLISNPQEYQYVYGYISPGSDTIDYYVLDFQTFTPQMQVALLKRSLTTDTSFVPMLVFGDPQQSRFIGQAPFGFPTNLGGRTYAWNNEPEEITDDTMYESLLKGPAFIRDFSPQRYIVAVHDPTGVGGRYVLYLGAHEPKKTIGNQFQAFLALLRIKLNLY